MSNETVELVLIAHNLSSTFSLFLIKNPLQSFFEVFPPKLVPKIKKQTFFSQMHFSELKRLVQICFESFCHPPSPSKIDPKKSKDKTNIFFKKLPNFNGKEGLVLRWIAALASDPSVARVRFLPYPLILFFLNICLYSTIF